MPVLIIAGMHRSGTTLTARWLQHSGLFIGEELLNSKYSHANPDGSHYEDMAFLNLHSQILAANRLNREGYIVDEKVHIASRFHHRAEKILNDRESQLQWGWKEPRTCLFMDFWNDFLPDARMLVVYRHYVNVADSLMRRKLNHPVLLRRWFYSLQFRNQQAHVAHYIAVWNRYNNELLKAVNLSPENSLVLRIGDIVSRSDDIISYLNRKWDFQLENHSANTVFQQDRLKLETEYVDLDAEPVMKVTQVAQKTYEALEIWRERSLARLE